MAIVNEKLAEKSAARGIPSTPAFTPSSSKLPQKIRGADDVNQDIDMALQAEQGPGDETAISLDKSDPKRDLAPMNWSGFEQRYAEAIKELNDNEDELIDHFNHLSEAFTIWADSSAERDNGRALKRLKTRERYVQIQEKSLEDKKLHYTKVVEAFKQALQLFGE
ncbi:predicted protein [Sclerotinia sclerotiorum 1980 UF-70]|uniref:Uncharacterized protein n=2 Tax=Sclerotinia sclerotiorum (strain ATCC 18683 / 1980 / Ss-1) TaxID=665079 RepID=A7F2W2_SCLS1|nr:predicted protein [Sclerotinia sclerotiorum 1980 UF-70]APA09455.1 hypothetical protein sscle_05g042250 [Sclerotinia sclerotiorum 1980 UF-70]EDN96054.1 predicted protein [Sclerotinia sclerotiorum 1980 UF-70]